MSRKSKRQVRKSASPTTVTVSTETPASTKSTGPNMDYGYVIKDLRRIGILAGSFIAILVILSFFLR